MKLKCKLFGHRPGVAELIFSGGRNTHSDRALCLHCGDCITVFTGTRSEWYKKHNLTHKDNESLIFTAATNTKEN